MTSRRESQMRPETPTRALLRRVQKRSSTGGSMAPPPLPNKEAADLRGNGQRLRSRMSSASLKGSSSESNGRDDSLRAKLAMLKADMDAMREEMESKDALILSLEEQLSEAIHDRQSGSTSGGLTKVAAMKLEREFASQERILQGLQKDNEAKTIEVERIRREKKLMVDHLSRQYGSDDWETIVFGPASSLVRANSAESYLSTRSAAAATSAPANTHATKLPSAGQTSTPSQTSKPPLHRFAPSSEMTMNDASFFSADESFMEPAVSSSAPQSTANIDLKSVLAMIESQKLLIKGFERQNALKMIDCREQMKIAREKERLWSERIDPHERLEV